MMKQISEEDRKILKGNLAMRDNPNSSKVQVAIANTVIYEIFNKYYGEEIDKALANYFSVAFEKCANIKDINLGDSKLFEIK